MPEINKRISEICDVCDSDKTITKTKLYLQDNIYPVYAGTIGKPIGFSDTFNNIKSPALIVVNDGSAGKTYIVNDEKYVIGKHATGLIVKPQFLDKIDIRYVQYVAEPLFLKKNKTEGRGNLPKSDILDTEIPIPVDDEGEIDYIIQKRIADNINLINEKRNELEKSKVKLLETYLQRDIIKGVEVKKIRLNDYFDLEREKIISNKYINNHKGKYPVYSTQDTVFGYIDTYMKKGKFLLWNTDGLAGYIKIVEGEFSYTNIVGIMLPRKNLSNVSLEYLKYYLEPIFRLHKKGREGIDGKNEYTKLNITMIKNMNMINPTKGNFFWFFFER